MEKYLVLHRFTSYGKVLTKGSIVTADQIRSPRLRMAEGKIMFAKDAFADVPDADEAAEGIPYEEGTAVSSQPPEDGESTDTTPPQENKESVDKKPGFSLFSK